MRDGVLRWFGGSGGEEGCIEIGGRMLAHAARCLQHLLAAVRGSHTARWQPATPRPRLLGINP